MRPTRRAACPPGGLGPLSPLNVNNRRAAINAESFSDSRPIRQNDSSFSRNFNER